MSLTLALQPVSLLPERHCVLASSLQRPRPLFFQVGYGPEPSNESVILTWTLPKAPEVQFIGFSTGWGSMGEFRIWRKMEVEESYSEAFTLGVPHSAIPGSERAAASLIGVSAPQPGLRGGARAQRARWLLQAQVPLGFAGNLCPGACSHTPSLS